MPAKGHIEDLTNRVFGRLTVVRRLSNKYRYATRWLCRCSCGTQREVIGNNLKSGKQVSCGCWKNENSAQRVRTHGRSHTPEYRVWTGIKKRCYQTACRSFPDYGGRGITMCDRWRESFVAFFADMGPRPPGASIDRRDNDGPYSPSNCQWAFRTEQNNNTRRNHYIEWKGDRLTLAQWAERYHISAYVLMMRLQRGWPVEKALTGKLQKAQYSYLTMNGVTRSLDEWATVTGITKGCIRTRIGQSGWSIDRALTEPMHTPGWPRRHIT